MEYGEIGEVSPVLEEFRRKTLIQEQYRADFFKLPQREQLKELVRRAVIDVFGSSWTTPESRERVAEDAARAQDEWDAKLRHGADLAAFEGRLDRLEELLNAR